MPDIELKLCPFCGSEAKLEYGHDEHEEWFNLGCSRHWGKVPPGEQCPGGELWYVEELAEIDKAVLAWNTRADLTLTPAELRQVHSALEELVAMVRGECPSLLNEDSGGNARLAEECDAALAILYAKGRAE